MVRKDPIFEARTNVKVSKFASSFSPLPFLLDPHRSLFLPVG